MSNVSLKIDKYVKNKKTFFASLSQSHHLLIKTCQASHSSSPVTSAWGFPETNHFTTVVCNSEEMTLFLWHTCGNLQKEDTAPTASPENVQTIFTWRLLYPPDTVICCSYFINVLLTIIGLKAAKLHIINCNKWRPEAIFTVPR